MPPPPDKPLWRQPASLALFGLAIAIGGWLLSTWQPPAAPRSTRQADELQQIRGMSDDPELTARLEQVAEQARGVPPLLLPGRLICLGGAALFVVGAVRMYRAPKGPPRDEDPEPDPEAEDFAD